MQVSGLVLFVLILGAFYYFGYLHGSFKKKTPPPPPPTREK